MVNISLGDAVKIVRMSKLRAVLSLTRWREHVPYTIPTVIAGAMMALYQTQAQPDMRLVAVVLANILAQSFAFMINDVADAPDDALDPKKSARNMISNGTLSFAEGIGWSWVVFIASLALFALAGPWAFVLGAIQLILSYLYSAHPFRWKARVGTDVISHALMLAALLVMTGFFTYSATPGLAWWMFACAFFFSAYGQFFNQIDDYEVDKAAGLRNTVVLLGRRGTRVLMYVCAFLAVGSASVGILSGVFPSWLATIALVSIFACALFLWDTDMRGNKAEGSGAFQKPALLMMNIVMLTWLAQSIGFIRF
jgi:4-hydroxybenzoate polyprenyltransferase